MDSSDSQGKDDIFWQYTYSTVLQCIMSDRQLCGLLNLQGWMILYMYDSCKGCISISSVLFKVFKFNTSTIITQDVSHWAISMNLDDQYYTYWLTDLVKMLAHECVYELIQSPYPGWCRERQQNKYVVFSTSCLVPSQILYYCTLIVMFSYVCKTVRDPRETMPSPPFGCLLKIQLLTAKLHHIHTLSRKHHYITMLSVMEWAATDT